MSETGKALDTIVRYSLAATMKERAFRKAGRMWRRAGATPGSIQVVNLQGSAWNEGMQGRCTMNAGVYFSSLADSLGIGRVTSAPTEPDCHVRVRPAMLRPGRRDTWFEFSANDDESLHTAALALDLLFREQAEPWLSQCSTLSGARNELIRTGHRWQAAAASLELGDRAGATSLPKEAIAKAPQTYAPHLVRWGFKHALLNDHEAAI
jgi:hypothetical protein